MEKQRSARLEGCARGGECCMARLCAASARAAAGLVLELALLAGDAYCPRYCGGGGVSCCCCCWAATPLFRSQDLYFGTSKTCKNEYRRRPRRAQSTARWSSGG